MDKLGVSEDDLDAMTGDLNALTESGNTDDEGRAPAIDLEKLFSGQLPQQAPESKGSSRREQEPKKQEKQYKNLNQFCINLTQRAYEGKLDRIVGRDSELERVMQILCRRQKNNPCLIGEPGVGKTAIAEALAMRIAEGNVPAKLENKNVMLVDMTSIVAGTQFRGQFETRMKGIIDEAKAAGNVILVIDEVHSIVAAGDAEGGMNAANILKPALSRGEIQIIGSTTLTEYRKHIEKDSALERRFQTVTVAEPSVESTVKILLGIKKYYEQYHGIKIPDQLVRRIAVLSERYITDRFLPDKAIDLMDEAASQMAMNSPIVNDVEKISKELMQVVREKEELEGKPEKDEETYKLIAQKTTLEKQLRDRFDSLSAQRDKLELTENDIAKVIEIWTGIPASNISENEFEKISRIEEALKDRIVGQDEAITKIAKSIKRSRAGISYKKKPVSFIFAGTTGVGKTELVKVLAKYLFDTPESLVRLDMSEFMEKHSVSRIIGSPPGYVGYDDAGQLTEKIRRKPYTVVLFDEIEKAHPDVLNILLQILDDGRITDAHGKEVNFENAIIVMTTNAGSDVSSSLAGFGKTAHQSDTERVMKSLEGFLRPEFINRVDDIVVFNRLTKENFAAICRIMLGDLQSILSEKGITLTYTDTAVQYLVDKGFSEKYGARNLRRLIQTDIEDRLAAMIVDSRSSDGRSFAIDAADGALKIN